MIAKWVIIVSSLIFGETILIAMLYPQNITLDLAILSSVSIVTAVCTMAYVYFDKPRMDE